MLGHILRWFTAYYSNVKFHTAANNGPWPYAKLGFRVLCKGYSTIVKIKVCGFIAQQLLKTQHKSIHSRIDWLWSCQERGSKDELVSSLQASLLYSLQTLSITHLKHNPMMGWLRQKYLFSFRQQCCDDREPWRGVTMWPDLYCPIVEMKRRCLNLVNYRRWRLSSRSTLLIP